MRCFLHLINVVTLLYISIKVECILSLQQNATVQRHLGNSLMSLQPDYEIDDWGEDESVGIVGGDNVEIGELSFFVFIRISLEIKHGNRAPKKYLVRCGGSAISADVVLTAAHCITARGSGSHVVSKEPTTLYANTYDLKNPTKIIRKEDIEYIKVHPGFLGDRRCDIGLIKVSSRTFDKTIPIAGDRIREGNPVWTAGYGRLSCGGMASRYLKHVELDVKEYKGCASRETGRWGVYLSDVQIEEYYKSVICAGRDNQHGSQSGDSGGPLYSVNRRGKPEALEGTTVGGSECKYKQDIAWYTDVSLFINWIQEETNCDNCYSIAYRCYECKSSFKGYCGYPNFDPSHRKVKSRTCFSNEPKCWAMILNKRVFRGCGNPVKCSFLSSTGCPHTKTNCAICCEGGGHCNNWSLLSARKSLSTASSSRHVDKFTLLVGFTATIIRWID